MHKRTLTGSTCAVLIALVASLILVPSADVQAAQGKADSTRTERAQGFAPKPSTDSETSELEEGATPALLYARSNYSWPYAKGPYYEDVESSKLEAPGVYRSVVGSFDLTRGLPALPDALVSPLKFGQLGAQYFVVMLKPDVYDDGSFLRLKEEVEAAGGALLGAVAVKGVLARLTAEAHDIVQSDRSVLAVQPYHAAFKLAPQIGRAPLPDPFDALSTVYRLDVQLFGGEDANLVAQAIAGLGGTVLHTAPGSLTVELDRGSLAALAALEPVQLVTESRPLVKHGEETTNVTQTGGWFNRDRPYHENGINGGGYFGTCTGGLPCQGDFDCPGGESCTGFGPAQVLMIVDSGIQMDAHELAHTDASSGETSPGSGDPIAGHRKVLAYETTGQFGGTGDDRGCDAASNGGNTHGHIVASTALGNGTLVPLRFGIGFQPVDNQTFVEMNIDGVAPRAMLVAYDSEVTPVVGNCDIPGVTGLNPGNVYAVSTNHASGSGSLEKAYHTPYFATTANFSWGVSNDPTYGGYSKQIDDFLVDPLHKEAMVFVSAGNDGQDVNPDDQIPDPNSISRPATCKNCVVVGGSGQPDSLTPNSNHEDRYAASSVGPATSYGRIAPLLMAPAVDFGSPLGNYGLDSEFACGTFDNDQEGAPVCDVKESKNGTSFASPAAAGAGMLVRDYFAQGFYPTGVPVAGNRVSAISGALVKAALIASADWMNDRAGANFEEELVAPGGNLTKKFRFNREQGYGRIQLNNVLPLANSDTPTALGLAVADGLVSNLNTLGMTGGSINNLEIDLDAGETEIGSFEICDDTQDVRVALVWIDTDFLSDPPYPRGNDALQTDLDLEVTAPGTYSLSTLPDGKTYYGNFFTEDVDRDDVKDTAAGFVEDCPGIEAPSNANEPESRPWSLPINGCGTYSPANGYRQDRKNPTEAVFLASDPMRNDDALVFTDKQTKVGTWTVKVRDGGVGTGKVRYALVVSGGVCVQSSIRLDQATYSCNGSAILTVNEKAEVPDSIDPVAGLTALEVKDRTTLEVVDLGPDGLYGTSDDSVVDTEPGPTFTKNDLNFVSASVTLSETYPQSGNGALDVKSGVVIRVNYADETAPGGPDPAKLRSTTARIACSSQLTIADFNNVPFQRGYDDAFYVLGGCERDARGLFTWLGNGSFVGAAPQWSAGDRYMDQGEQVTYIAYFTNTGDEDLIDANVELRCVETDTDSPATCPTNSNGVCADPNRLNNTSCAGISIAGPSPKVIGDLPAGETAAANFTVKVDTATTRTVEMVLGVSSPLSGQTAKTYVLKSHKLNVDESSFYYSTDFPGGGVTEWRDFQLEDAVGKPSNEKGGNTTSVPANPGGDQTCVTPGSDCDNPVTSPDWVLDYQFETIMWSDLTRGGTVNTGLLSLGPWRFDANNGGFTVALNNTSTPAKDVQPERISNWGEDLNGNGIIDYGCSVNRDIECPGPSGAGGTCGICNDDLSIVCVTTVSGGNADCPVNSACIGLDDPWDCCTGPTAGTCTQTCSTAATCSVDGTILCRPSMGNADCGGTGTCTANLGNCVSDEDRDVLGDNTLQNNWATTGGCGWQTNASGASTDTGGIWHTGRIGATTGTGATCLVVGATPGNCQQYDVLGGDTGVKTWWELLLTPVVNKVNTCPTGTETNCGGQADAVDDPVFQVQFMQWAWNMEMDLKDEFATMSIEWDTDLSSSSKVDLINDNVGLNFLTGNQGPISDGNSPLTSGFQMFADVDGFTSTSKNGTVGVNRIGRNNCAIDNTAFSLIQPFHLAYPKDDDINQDGDGTTDEGVNNYGPIRNWDIREANGLDMRWSTLEDLYGPSGEAYQGAVGFLVNEATPDKGAALSSYGIGLDDMVVQWREFKLVSDGTDCSTSGTCARVHLDSTNIYEGIGILGITVIDTSPYRCVSPPCTPFVSDENKNDCNLDGDFTDPGDDDNCDNDAGGIKDLVVRVTSEAEIEGEIVYLNRVGATNEYKGTVGVTTTTDVDGQLFILPAGTDNPTITVRYEDHWDGTAAGTRCQNDPSASKQGFLTSSTAAILDRNTVVVTGVIIDDTNGDLDGFPDTGETFDMFLTVSNKSGLALSNVVAQLTTSDPKIDCIFNSVAFVGSLAKDETKVVASPFTLKVHDAATRLNDAGSGAQVTCVTPGPGGTCSNFADTPACTADAQCQRQYYETYSAKVTVTMASDQFDALRVPQDLILDLDLNANHPFPGTATANQTEGFETGLGKFDVFQDANNPDYLKANNTLSNGYRCQYNDPDFINSNSLGEVECYMGFTGGQFPVNDWHVEDGLGGKPATRAYLGNNSLHWGKHLDATGDNDTTSLSQLDVAVTKGKQPFVLAARICSGGTSPSPPVACNVDADCNAYDPGADCVGATPLLSFKHQVSLADFRSTNTPDNESVDRAIVQAQNSSGAAGLGPWVKLYPFQNIYDVQGTDAFTNCKFDPIDDGNDEDDYFDPTDPARRLGPSSTCFPEFVFGFQGDTFAAFQSDQIGRASDPPGLQGSVGKGTWVETKFSLDPLRGRKINLRFLTTSIKVADTADIETTFTWNPTPDDDGWYIDDILVTQTLPSIAHVTTSVDTADRSALPGCGTNCDTLTAALVADPNPSPAPGRLVELSARNSSSNKCISGTLLYQFWLDDDGDGDIAETGETMLQDFSASPVYDVSPSAVTTKYGVVVKCSSGTTAPCNGAELGVTVTTNCPDLNPGKGTPVPTISVAKSGAGPSYTADVSWTNPGAPAAFDAVKGDVGLLRSSGTYAASGQSTVLSGASVGTFADSAAPLAGGTYYLVKEEGWMACNFRTSWTSGGTKEVGGGSYPSERDTEISCCP